MEAIVIVIILFIWAIPFWLMIYTQTKARKRAVEWAHAKNYEVINAHAQYAGRRPFIGVPVKRMRVRLTVKDSGEEKVFFLEWESAFRTSEEPEVTTE